MGKIVGYTGDEAIAEAAALCNPDVISAYPITPQTIIVEHLSQMVADGKLDCEFVSVESEHSALTCTLAASLTGARTFTASASQGILLMYEILYVTANARAPIIMGVANRALSGPINIHAELTDMMVCRDAGWMEFFTSSAQAAYDNIIQAYRIAEDPEVLTPAMVGQDGFIISHALERVEPVDKKFIRDFLPDYKREYQLDPDRPITVGLLVLPDYYTESKYQQVKALEKAKQKIVEVGKEFGEQTGRYYGLIDTYEVEDADVTILTMGAFAGTARDVVTRLRAKGKKAGLIEVRTYRPFPGEELLSALDGTKSIIVFERSLAYGGLGSALYTDVKALLYDVKERPALLGFVGGLGGRDLAIREFLNLFERGFEAIGSEEPSRVEWIGLRE
ncbi:MAG: transketolase C-terminal domain-containing protein [Candidatus Heimdallarchaeota archaeon]